MTPRTGLRAAALALACLLLCACAAIDPAAGGYNIEDLLRAPRTSGRQSAVLTALNDYLGDTLQLKYPRGGGEPNPVLFADLDGDGALEAAILYTAPSKGQNVHLAVLEAEEDGWRVSFEVMGLSTEVAEVELTEVFPGSQQLLVGFANAGLTDKYLDLYDYRDNTVYTACRQPYDVYWLGAPDGQPLLALAGSGTSSLQLFSPNGRSMAQQHAVQLDARFERCTGLYYTDGAGFLVDGLTATGAQSQFVRLGDGALESCGESGVYTRARGLAALTPRDFGGAGEVLAADMRRSIPTLRSADRFYEIAWSNALRTRAVRRYGIWDAQQGFFLRLPESWRGAFSLTELSDLSWQLRRRRDNALLLEVRVSSEAVVPEGSVRAARTAEGLVLLRFGAACSDIQESLILRGVTAI